MRRLLATIAALAAFAAYGVGVGTAKFGDIGLDDNVVTNLDLSGVVTVEADPFFTAWLADYTPPNTDLTPATNYTDKVAGEFEDGTRTAQYANNSGHTDYAVYLHSDDASESYTATDLMRGATNAANAVAAPLRQDVSDLRTESSLVYRLYQGSNVVAEVTNYNSQVNAPELKIMQLNESNEYVTVWAETNGLARTLASAVGYVDGATNALREVYAPRAWSRTSSGLGAEVPSNMTWISTPKTVIAGGFDWEKHVDSYGEVWVLTSNGMAMDFDPDTNAYLRITANDGTPVFSIEKTDAMMVGANATGITVGETTVTIPVPVVSPSHPTCFWRYSLEEGEWADESAAPQAWDFNWQGDTGTWTLVLDLNGTRPPSLFFKFEFLQPGGTLIRNSAPLDVSQGIMFNGHLYVPSVSGNNLIWTMQQ